MSAELFGVVVAVELRAAFAAGAIEEVLILIEPVSGGLLARAMEPEDS